MIVIRSAASQQTLSGLRLNYNYTVNISAAKDFSSYRGGNCYNQYVYGEDGDPVYAYTREGCMFTVQDIIMLVIMQYVALSSFYMTCTSDLPYYCILRYQMFTSHILGKL